MDYFDFEEASHAIPSVEIDDVSTGFDDGSFEPMPLPGDTALPNPTTNTKPFGTIFKLKLINDREVEAILWDHDNATDHPMFRAREACELCSRMNLDCFLASRGALISGCTCCISLFRECSFTHVMPPKGYYSTFPGIAEDSQVCEGTMQQTRPWLKSYEDAKSRKTGARFPREAVKILKRWLSEHAEHPYPNEREKEDLKQLTGLRRGQIQNWLANARRRGKVRGPSDPASPVLGAVDIPSSKTVADMNPLDRWKISPPEHEPALMTDIARAVSEAPVSESVQASQQNSRANSRANSRKDSSDDGSNWSVFRAPTVSSFETKDSSNSDFSFASSRSQQSKMSKISHTSSQERRRRRRAPMTQRAIAQANKARSARVFQCTFCTDSFPAKYDWQRHEKSLHLALERWICCPTGGTITVPSTGQIRCAFCQEFDPTPAHLESHNFSACNEKSMSERTFYRKDHLRQHLKLMHDAKFNPAMEAWKSTTNEIQSRCGFCPSLFTTWQQRVDHLAAHYRNGADMRTWDGGWGFEPHVEKVVENAIPPYLIAQERNTMKPFVARLATRNSSSTPGLSNCESPEDDSCEEVDQFTRDSNCWFRLEQELLNNFVAKRKAIGHIPTDQELQNEARMIVYGDPDPLDWTCADNATWLQAFKVSAGIASPPVDCENKEFICKGTRYVPIMAPYAVKGGLKNNHSKKLSISSTHNMTNDPANQSFFMERLCPTTGTPVTASFDLPDTPFEFDPNMQLDFQPDDFAALDLEDLDELSFGIDHTKPASFAPGAHTFNTFPTTTAAGYEPAAAGDGTGVGGLFGPLEMPMDFRPTFSETINHGDSMSDHDFNQLTGYMSGFNPRPQM